MKGGRLFGWDLNFYQAKNSSTFSLLILIFKKILSTPSFHKLFLFLLTQMASLASDIAPPPATIPEWLAAWKIKADLTSAFEELEVEEPNDLKLLEEQDIEELITEQKVKKVSSKKLRMAFQAIQKGCLTPNGGNQSVPLTPEIKEKKSVSAAAADFAIPGITWKPPSKREKALTLRHELQLLQDQLTSNGRWTSEERTTVTEQHLAAAKSFLDLCKAEAAKDLGQLKDVVNKLEKKYTPLYDATATMIQNDDPAWPQALELGNKLERQSKTGSSFCQDRNQLVRLYQDAQRVKPTFIGVFSEVAASTSGKFTPGTLKPLFRALEKTVMKPSDDPTLDRADRVCDVVRGMLVYKNFGDMVLGMQAMVDHADVQHMRTKCRFAVPTSGGWRDVVSNVKFRSDDEGHICEIQ